MKMWQPCQFERIRKARFVRRPNRFLAICRLPGVGQVRAHLPSSGRLRELLIPGASIWLEDHGPYVARATRYTLLAAERLGRPVFLHTHRTNDLARCLIERGVVPGLKRARIERAEATVGSSRFDFLLSEGCDRIYLEVKSVTLFANRVAMFPDAPSLRAAKHLRHLAELAEARPRTRARVLFIVHHPEADWFMPDYHTDPDFAHTMLDVRHRVRFVALGVGWTPDMTLEPFARPLRIPWKRIQAESHDAGAYLLVLRLNRARRLQVGRLGSVAFPAGYYVYVGSARKGLEARIRRHLRRRKRMHWHVDYLRAVADSARALPIRSSRRDECSLARALARALEPAAPGFGASDCACPTHLFRCSGDPLDLPAFQDVLLDFRLRPPGR